MADIDTEKEDKRKLLTEQRLENLKKARARAAEVRAERAGMKKDIKLAEELEYKKKHLEAKEKIKAAVTGEPSENPKSEPHPPATKEKKKKKRPEPESTPKELESDEYTDEDDPPPPPKRKQPRPAPPVQRQPPPPTQQRRPTPQPMRRPPSYHEVRYNQLFSQTS